MTKYTQNVRSYVSELKIEQFQIHYDISTHYSKNYLDVYVHKNVH